MQNVFKRVCRHLSWILRTYLGTRYLFKYNKNEKKKAVVLYSIIKHLQTSITC